MRPENVALRFCYSRTDSARYTLVAMAEQIGQVKPENATLWLLWRSRLNKQSLKTLHVVIVAKHLEQVKPKKRYSLVVVAVLME